MAANWPGENGVESEKLISENIGGSTINKLGG